MTTDLSATPDRDERLREALRGLPPPADAARLEGLSARVLAQWRTQHGGDATEAGDARGPAASLIGRRGRRPLWIVATGLLASVAIVLGVWLKRPDPVLEELMQPDVLSQMAAGEM